jgi:hypothetical protein
VKNFVMPRNTMIQNQNEIKIMSLEQYFFFFFLKSFIGGYNEINSFCLGIMYHTSLVCELTCLKNKLSEVNVLRNSVGLWWV